MEGDCRRVSTLMRAAWRLLSRRLSAEAGHQRPGGALPRAISARALNRVSEDWRNDVNASERGSLRF
jgi:hypothetical protein